MNKPNGNGQAQTQINPVEAAQFALIFLGRAQFNRSERQMFDVADALLNAIVSGQVRLESAQPQAIPESMLEAPAPRPDTPQ